MAYPWPSLGTFIFDSTERPIGGTDTRWRRSPKRDRSTNLGSTADSIRTLGIGSSTRTFEILLEPDRFAELEAFIGVPGLTFTDWNRPTPVSRGAYLANLEPVEEIGANCTDNDQHLLIRSKVELISQ